MATPALTSGITDALGTAWGIGRWILLGGLAIGIVGSIIWFLYNKKSWWIKVEVKLPRSDGRFIDAEWAKGKFDAKKGVVWIKRKGKSKVAMKPFKLQRYLQGTNVLTVIQTGLEMYEPVFPESFCLAIDDQTGEEVQIINLKLDNTKDKAWKNSFERDSKNAFRISNFVRDNIALISIGLVMLLWGIQFAILYQKIKG